MKDTPLKKAEDAHTPTPWTSATIIQRGFLYEQIHGPTKDRHRGIALVYLGKPNTIIEPENEANAAFIVQSVNNFKPMLKGLKMAVDRFSDIYRTHGINCDQVRDALRDIITKADSL